MHRLNTHSENRVQMAAGRFSSEAFKYGGHLGTHLICGGVDVKGPQLIEISNDGNCYAFPFLTMGSGCLAAMAVIETGYKEDMNEEEAKAHEPTDVSHLVDKQGVPDFWAKAIKNHAML